jgi:hypothetical protein
MLNEWALESLKSSGIVLNKDGTVEVCFSKNIKQTLPNIEAVFRQQAHIIKQQENEQSENEEIATLVIEFYNIVLSLSKMTVKQLTRKRKNDYVSELISILAVMSQKTNDLRKQTYKNLSNILKMIEKNNLPAAITASRASLEKIRKRWLINEKIIEKAESRYSMLKVYRHKTTDIFF